MSTVYVLQKHLHWDASRQSLVEKFDFSAASEYGEIKYLVSHNLSPFNPDAAIDIIRQSLEEVDFREDDYLLLAGNPCLIAWVAALAADRTGGRLRLLQWHGRERRYILVDSTVWDDEEGGWVDTDE